MRIQSWVVVVAALAVGCTPAPGALSVTPRLELGPASCRVSGALTLTNTGGTTIAVTGVERVSGVPVQTSPFLGGTGSVFTLELPAARELAPGATATVTVKYLPDLYALEQWQEATVAFMAGELRAEATLKGTRQSIDTSGPVDLDFGGASVGEGVFSTFTSPAPDGGRGLEGRDGGIFSAGTDGVGFLAEEPGDYADVLWLRPPGCTTAVPFRVAGTAVPSAVTWTPGISDFGYVPAGQLATRAFRFQNYSFRQQDISQLEILEGVNPSSTFQLQAGTRPDPKVLSLARAERGDGGVLVPGEGVLEVTFTPFVIGPKTARLNGATTLPRQAFFTIPLRGVGGGPNIAMDPATTLDLGAVTAPSEATVTIRNVGTMPSPPDPKANLYLGQDGGEPYSELLHVSGVTGNLTVVGPNGYDAMNGLEPTSAVVTFRVQATVSGPSRHTLRIFSNDHDQPVLSLTIVTR